MLSNRSMPEAKLTPVIGYPDVRAAAGWLCEAFGFEIRLEIGDHRMQLRHADASLIVRQADGARDPEVCSMLLRVEDIDQAAAKVVALGGLIVRPPAAQPYGERQCNVADPWGMAWTLSQTLGDVPPEDWLES